MRFASVVITWICALGTCGCSDEAAAPVHVEPAACANAVSGKAPKVEFTIVNASASRRFYGTKCGSAFHLWSPRGGYAPANPNVLICDTAPETCDYSCTDVEMHPVEAKTSVTVAWDGVLFMPVDSGSNGCTAANAGESCFATCARRKDGDFGEYAIKYRLYEEDLSLTEFDAFFTYPDETKVTVEIP